MSLLHVFQVQDCSGVVMHVICMSCVAANVIAIARVEDQVEDMVDAWPAPIRKPVVAIVVSPPLWWAHRPRRCGRRISSFWMHAFLCW